MSGFCGRSAVFTHGVLVLVIGLWLAFARAAPSTPPTLHKNAGSRFDLISWRSANSSVEAPFARAVVRSTSYVFSRGFRRPRKQTSYAANDIGGLLSKDSFVVNSSLVNPAPSFGRALVGFATSMVLLSTVMILFAAL